MVRQTTQKETAMRILARLALNLALCGLAGVAHAQIVPIWWNNLYYQKGGEFLVLTGYHSIAPTGPYEDQVTALASHGIHYARVWHMCGSVPNGRPWPFIKDPDTLEWHFDYGAWNEAYWGNFRRALSLARDNDIVAEVHLFDRSGVGWDAANVVPCSGGKNYLADKTQDPFWAAAMERYVDKLITDSYGFEYVIYEVDQESQISDPSWHLAWAQFVRRKLTSLGTNPERVVTITPPASALAALGGWDLSAVDTINLHIGQSENPRPGLDVGGMVAYLQDKRTWIRGVQNATHGKAVSVDEFGNSMTDENQLRMLAWTFLTSGAHFHIEDVLPGWEFIAFNVAGAVERWKGNWEFWHFTPSDEPVVSSGLARFCMKGVWPANNGTEYLCYVPAVPLGSDAISVTLPRPPAG